MTMKYKTLREDTETGVQYTYRYIDIVTNISHHLEHQSVLGTYNNDYYSLLS